MNNDEIKHSVIISRRPTQSNEFIFERNNVVNNVERMLNYIQDNSNLIIEQIPREELPWGEGLSGWRVHKGDLT